MTRAEILAALDAKFAAFMLEEVDRMRAEGMSELLIFALVTENTVKFQQNREAHADWVICELPDLRSVEVAGTA